jgi:periplasmic copper chaperone A
MVGRNGNTPMLSGLRFIAAVVAVVLPLSSAAHQTRHKTLTVVHPWVLETERPEADLHVLIKNTGQITERLLGASTPVATSASILDAIGQGVPELTIPQGGELTLKPGEARIILVGLRKPLRPYDTFALTLVFKRAGIVEVEVIVEENTRS